MEDPNMKYFPRNFNPQISNALRKKGVGSLIFNMTKGTSAGYPIQRMIVLDDKLMKIKKPTYMDEKPVDNPILSNTPFKIDQIKRLKKLRKYFEDE